MTNSMMKSMGLGLFMTSLSMGMASAADAPPSHSCAAEAERAVARFVPNGRYDDDGFYTYRCELTPNRAATACEVSASKGGGEASDTYRVILARKCDRVFRVELVGEE